MTDQTTIQVCRTMTDQARMNDWSTEKLEDQMTRYLTIMQVDEQMNKQANEQINEQMNKQMNMRASEQAIKQAKEQRRKRTKNK